MSPESDFVRDLMELAKARSRSSWNDRLEHWERPASDSEEQIIQRAAGMVKSALNDNTWLTAQGVTVSPQGSYHNNTNIRLESDMDIRVVHPDLRAVYAPNVIKQYADSALTITNDTGRTYGGVDADMRRQITAALRTKFKTSEVDDSSNKALRVKKLPGSRADVDVVPAFRYLWIQWDETNLRYTQDEGITILGKSGGWIHNFPEQHYANGVAKRGRTRHRFKRIVRMLKVLRDDLTESKILKPKQVPSFLIECLVYVVEDQYFLGEEDDRYDRLRRVLYRLQYLLNDAGWTNSATEINGIKFLFHTAQPWTVDVAKLFVLAALANLEA